jgi:hypothetical protein
MKLVQVLAQSHYMHNPTSLRALFSLPGFVATSRLLGVFRERYAGVLVVRRGNQWQSARSVRYRCRERYDNHTCRARNLSTGEFRIAGSGREPTRTG